MLSPEEQFESILGGAIVYNRLGLGNWGTASLEVEIYRDNYLQSAHTHIYEVLYACFVYLSVLGSMRGNTGEHQIVGAILG